MSRGVFCVSPAISAMHCAEHLVKSQELGCTLFMRDLGQKAASTAALSSDKVGLTSHC